MPSVQELLLALNAQKSPLVSLLEGVAGGYNNAQQNRIENTKRLMEIDQMRQQQQQQAAMQKQIADQIESKTQSDLKSTGSGTPVVPTQKFETEISQDEKGNYSRKFKTVDTAPKAVETVIYQTPTGENRIGKKSDTGDIVQSPNDPLAPTQPKDAPLSLADQLEARDKAKLAREKPKAQGALQNTMSEYDNMIAEANAIKNDPSLSSATGIVSPLAHIPGTGAKRVSARLDTLKAKTLLNVLSSLKQLSSNGSSGFGALSTSEGDAIKNSISSLDPSMSTKDLQASIDRFTTEMEARKKNLKSTFEDTYGTSGARTTPNSTDNAGGGTFDADVMAYAQKHNISPAQAAEIKRQRTGAQ